MLYCIPQPAFHCKLLDILVFINLLTILYIFYHNFKFNTTESMINNTANAVVPFFKVPSAERPLFLLQYVSLPPDAPPVSADNPASLPSCINTITERATHTKIYTIVKILLIVVNTHYTSYQCFIRVVIPSPIPKALIDVIITYFSIFFNLFYFFINKDFPVISAGCSIPIISINVGAISARHPPSRKV